MNSSKVLKTIVGTILAGCVLISGFWVHGWLERNRVLRDIVKRLSAESRAAEVLVTKSEFDETTKKIRTTIKFLEYDAEGKALAPKYFSFQGNLIQFQALVIRFQDRLVKSGDKLRGKSAYLFLKAFVLDGANTQVFDITKQEEVPRGYKVTGANVKIEQAFWEEFWDYAFDPKHRDAAGIKNAQIEAPGSLFLPGTIYTIHIEHDGGLRIDPNPVPEVLKGEQL